MESTIRKVQVQAPLPASATRAVAGTRDLDFMTESSVAVLEDTPRGARLLLWSAIAFIAIAVAWANWATLDEVTRGEGKIIPSKQVQVLQNLEGGILSEILVQPGDVVERGQVLLRIDDTRFAASLQESRLQYMALKAKAARLRAEAEGVEFVAPDDVEDEFPKLIGQELDLFKSRQKQHQRSYALVLRELNMMRPLVAEGAISEVEVLRLQRQVNEIKMEFRNSARGELNEVVAELSGLEEAQRTMEDRVSRTLVRSPMKGTVKQVMVTTIGGVIKPGMDLVEVVPLEDKLRVEARVRPADIAFLHPGQRAMVKFTAYDFAIYGGLEAEVTQISADTILDEEGESYYLVRVETDETYLGSESDPLPIIPGMVAQVDVLTGKKTVMEYLLKPVLRAKAVAMRER